MKYSTMKDYVNATISSTGSWIGNIYDLTILTYVYVELEKYYHITLLDVSLLFALGLIGRFFGGIYLGNLSDKRGSRYIMMISTAGYAIFAGIMAFSPDVIILFLARFIQGIFMGGEWASGSVLGYEFSPANKRGTIFGIIQSGYGIGYALTGVTYLLFLPTIAINWRYFLITGTIPLIIAPYTLFKVPKDVLKNRNNEKIRLMDYKRPLIKSMIMLSGFFAAYFSIFSFYPTIAPSFGIPPSMVGYMMIVTSLVITAAFIIFGRLAMRISKRILLMAGAIIALIFAWFAMPFYITLRPFSLFGLVIFTIGIGSMPIVPLLLMERINPIARGTISGISYNFGALFGGIISVLLGFIGDIIGYSGLLVIIDVTTLLCLISVIITAYTIKNSSNINKYNIVKEVN